MATIDKIKVGDTTYDICSKAKLVEKVYYLGHNSYNDEGGDLQIKYGFRLTEPLKKNQFYLVKYYNDEWGTDVWFIGHTLFEGANDFISPKSTFIIDNLNNIYIFIFSYFEDYSLGGINKVTVPFVKVGADNVGATGDENFVQLEDTDYIEVYELPMTFEEVMNNE